MFACCMDHSYAVSSPLKMMQMGEVTLKLLYILYSVCKGRNIRAKGACFLHLMHFKYGIYQ